MFIDLTNKHTGYLTRLDKGLYLVDHWYAKDRLRDDFYEFLHEWPELNVPVDERLKWVGDRARQGLFCSTYGSCDSPEQFKDHEQYGQVIARAPEAYIVTFDYIAKEDSGYRWHKNGPYIGTLRQGYEYLNDEPDIEGIYQFSVFRKKEYRAVPSF